MRQSTFGHVIGGALLVAGTSIGAGMLALPLVSAKMGFFPSIIVFFICWAVMTATGFLFLEIALNMPEGSNIISMSEKYLGKAGKYITWFFYLFLFYCLLIAYVAGGGALLKGWFPTFLSDSGANILFAIVFSLIIYFGAKTVDRFNILLMLGLGISYLFFLIAGSSHVELSLISSWRLKNLFYGIPIILISFGYQGLMPSLVYYMQKDIKKIKLAILIGTSLTFLIYVFWNFLILSIVPYEGEHGLNVAMRLGDSAIAPLQYFVKNKNIFVIGNFFSFFAITTSFLGVGLGLFDFLSDGLKIEKKGGRRFLLFLMILLPPGIISIINPKLFIIALGYAGGVGGIFLLVILPCLLSYSARYVKKDPFIISELPGGKFFLVLITIFALGVGFIEFFVK